MFVQPKDETRLARRERGRRATLLAIAVLLPMGVVRSAWGDIGANDSPSFAIDARPAGHAPAALDSAIFAFDGERVARAWADSGIFGISAPPGAPAVRTVRFTDGTPIARARVWAYYLTGAPADPVVTLIDPDLPEVTDATGYFARPRAFADALWTGTRLGLVAAVTYVDPATGVEHEVVNYAGWDPYRPLAVRSDGSDTIEFPQPVVLQAGLLGGVATWFGDAQMRFGDYLISDPATVPKNIDVDAQGRRTPAFFAFAMPSRRDEPLWGYDHALPVSGGAHELNRHALEVQLITSRMADALVGAGVIADRDRFADLQINVCGYGAGGLVTRAMLASPAADAPVVRQYVSLTGAQGGTTSCGMGLGCPGLAEWYLNGIALDPNAAPSLPGWNALRALSNAPNTLLAATVCDAGTYCGHVAPPESALGVARTVTSSGGAFGPNGHASRFVGGMEWATAAEYGPAVSEPAVLVGAARFMAYGLAPDGACASPETSEPCAGPLGGPEPDAVPGYHESVEAVPAGVISDRIVDVDANTVITFEALVEDHGTTFDVLDPNGVSVVPIDMDLIDLGDGYQARFSVSAPASGAYTVRILGGPVPTRALLTLRFDNLRALVVETPAAIVTPGEPAIVRARFVDEVGHTMIGNAAIAVDIVRPSGATSELSLLDDGAHNDDDPADGVYGNTFTETSLGGRYLVRCQGQVPVLEEVVQRSAVGAFMVAPTAGVLGDVLAERPVLAGDGRVQWIEFDVSATLYAAGDYELRGWLVDGSGAPLTYANKLLDDSQTGEIVTTLRFDARDLVAARVAGPWTLAAVSLVDLDESQVMDQLGDYTTAAYDLATLLPPAAPLLVATAPNHGPVQGGNEIVLLGKNLTFVVGVLWNDAPVPDYEIVSDATVRLTVPAIARSCADRASVRLITPWDDVLSSGIYVYGSSLVPVDFDCNGRVDGADFVVFAELPSGPDITVPPPGADAELFRRADLDGDLDVDLADCFELLLLAEP